MPNKTLLIGWDAADWKAITPLLEAGKMPNLAKMIAQGTSGNIATLQPVLSPMLWSSIATGKRPYKHGIHGFTEPDPITGSIRPVTNLSRNTKAIWNILNQNNHHTATIGWWPSNPVEPLSKGIMVSNGYQRATTSTPKKWPLKPGTIHPERLTKSLKELRFHPNELNEKDLWPFLPGIEGLPQAELDQLAKDQRIQSLMKIIADCTSIHSATTSIIENEPWDFMAVYYDAIDHFGHAFMKYHPPQRPGISDQDFRIFNYVNEAGYRYHDMMLGTLLRLAGEKTNVILISDHGFHPDDFRLSTIPREPAGPAAEHRQFGILVAKGPDIKENNKVFGASLLDITPTLLQLFDLPSGEDMDGKVLKDLFKENIKPIEKIPSWDTIEGDHGMHPPDAQISAGDSKAALQQLVALGYIEKPDEDQSKALEQTVRELDFNLAQAYIDGGLYLQACVILERLYNTWPLEHRFGFQLATCYQSLKRTKDLRSLVKVICQRRLQEANEAINEIEKTKPVNEAAALAEQKRIDSLDQIEQQKLIQKQRELIGKARPNLFSLRYLEATADFSEGNFQNALEKLDQLDSDYGARRTALTLKGEIHQKLKQWNKSQQAFEQALEFDRESPGPLLGLARTALAKKDYAVASKYASASTALLHFQPRAHYIRGMAEYRQHNFEAAEHAFLTTVRQAPLAAAAFRMLAEISYRVKKDPNLTTFYKQKTKESRQAVINLRTQKTIEVPELNQSSTASSSTPMPILEARPDTLKNIPEEEIITIVSGLPRSGTSLMMQLLEAANIPALTDNLRPADENNTKGYYEHQKVTSLLRTTDKSWIDQAKGKSLKVVAPLLASLPLQKEGKKRHYRLIFMERELSEVIQSQTTMISKLETKVTTSERPSDTSKAYNQQVRHAKNWINEHTISAISIPFQTLVHHPEQLLPSIAQFLDKSNKLTEMKKVIDPSLHRSKNSNGLINS